ncbi:MAG: MBL fold metallo-hydrolase [Dehalococcoidia bacterium]
MPKPVPHLGTDSTMQEVAEGVFAYIQAPGGFCIANAGLIAGPDGAIAVDALFTPAMTHAFQEQIRRHTSKPVRQLINTHHHIDHTLGNEHFDGVEIVAHTRCREHIARVGVPRERLHAVAPHFTPEIAQSQTRLPTVTFADQMNLFLGERRVQLTHLGTAHTVDDVLVYLPAEKVLFAGDVAFHYVTPLAFEGHISGWIRVLDAIERMDVETIVPGHGPVGDKSDLREMRDYLSLVRREARRGFEEGAPPEVVAERAKLGRFSRWGERERILPNIHRLYQEFRGEIKAG